jgi:hypothetical protein
VEARARAELLAQELAEGLALEHASKVMCRLRRRLGCCCAAITFADAFTVLYLRVYRRAWAREYALCYEDTFEEEFDQALKRSQEAYVSA